MISIQLIFVAIHLFLFSCVYSIRIFLLNIIIEQSIVCGIVSDCEDTGKGTHHKHHFANSLGRFRKGPYSPPPRELRDGGDQKMFLVIVNVLGHLNEVGGMWVLCMFPGITHSGF